MTTNASKPEISVWEGHILYTFVSDKEKILWL